MAGEKFCYGIISKQKDIVSTSDSMCALAHEIMV
jgi:hypothetical protein